ncbi:type II toxin-antitoxin system mRNA interferase toxin, RelE/StbE family [Patescibacteria group bacterium]|nr:type II toxin-antitoxin system mRNA interferase toxin, RelE/StbE family [Patescibacteria group bacterium]MBU1123012.1 type II toxin-antitoxin system mRNA interferase toxin, RelE/StbE family [Patescibacteria group bacterium]MBU1911738.1 type II toxin-antitoxin system mRNA interferase toxin, RelE/StbE family [Patescibacteria group bacterium]
MIKVRYRPNFLRQYKKLPDDLKSEIKEKIELFKEDSNNSMLRMHKLHGKIKGCLSFSVNYKYRIVFVWEEKNKIAALVAVGDHDMYSQINIK